LAAAGESRSIRDRRAQWVAALVAARPAPEAEDTTGWHEQVERNHDTVAATLQDTLHDHPDALGVRLAGQLESYWFIQGRASEGERWLQAALRQQDAPAADLATAELTLAFILALRGRPDLTPPLVRSALAKSDAVQPRLLAHQLALTAWWMFVGDGPADDTIDAKVRALAQEDPVIEAWADQIAAKSRLGADGPIVTGARAAELIERSERIGNIHAAWLAGRLAARSALIAEDAATGLRLLHHVAELHRRLGGKLTADLVEFEGCFAAMSGDHARAAMLFGQANTLAFPAGTNWPTNTHSETLLATVRRALPDEEFEAAWQAGAALAVRAG